jgi:flagellar L-ring protein FlgH
MFITDQLRISKASSNYQRLIFSFFCNISDASKMDLGIDHAALYAPEWARGARGPPALLYRLAGMAVLLAFGCDGMAKADNLYHPGITQSLTSDRRPQRVGDLITVVISENAQSSTSQQNATNRTTAVSAGVSADTASHNASLSTGNSFAGSGQVQRSESFVTQMTASIMEVLPNGDFLINGSERLRINGETTTIEVRGRIRSADINGNDQIQSNRIADAQVNYNGKGFVSRSAKPGIIQRIFSILGL